MPSPTNSPRDAGSDSEGFLGETQAPTDAFSEEGVADIEVPDDIGFESSGTEEILDGSEGDISIPSDISFDSPKESKRSKASETHTCPIDAVLVLLVTQARSQEGKELEASLKKIEELIDKKGADPNTYNNMSYTVHHAPPYASPALQHAVGNERLVEFLIKKGATRIRDPRKLIDYHGNLIEELDFTAPPSEQNKKGNVHITDATLYLLKECCPNLKRLNISHCPLITVEGIKYITSGKHLKALEALLMTEQDVKNKVGLLYLSQEHDGLSIRFWRHLAGVNDGKNFKPLEALFSEVAGGVQIGITEFIVTPKSLEHESWEEVKANGPAQGMIVEHCDAIIGHLEARSIIFCIPEETTNEAVSRFANHMKYIIEGMKQLECLTIKGPLTKEAANLVAEALAKAEGLKSFHLELSYLNPTDLDRFIDAYLAKIKGFKEQNEVTFDIIANAASLEEEAFAISPNATRLNNCVKAYLTQENQLQEQIKKLGAQKNITISNILDSLKKDAEAFTLTDLNSFIETYLRKIDELKQRTNNPQWDNAASDILTLEDVASLKAGTGTDNDHIKAYLQKIEQLKTQNIIISTALNELEDTNFLKKEASIQTDTTHIIPAHLGVFANVLRTHTGLQELTLASAFRYKKDDHIQESQRDDVLKILQAPNLKVIDFTGNMAYWGDKYLKPIVEAIEGHKYLEVVRGRCGELSGLFKARDDKLLEEVYGFTRESFCQLKESGVFNKRYSSNITSKCPDGFLIGDLLKELKDQHGVSIFPEGRLEMLMIDDPRPTLMSAQKSEIKSHLMYDRKHYLECAEFFVNNTTFLRQVVEEGRDEIDSRRYLVQLHRALKDNPKLSLYSSYLEMFVISRSFAVCMKDQSTKAKKQNFNGALEFLNHSEQLIAFFNGGNPVLEKGHYSIFSKFSDRASSITELICLITASTPTQQNIIDAFETDSEILEYVYKLGNDLLQMIFDGVISPAHTVEETGQIAALALSGSKEVLKERTGDITIAQLRDEMLAEFRKAGVVSEKILRGQEKMNARLGNIEGILKKDREQRQKDVANIMQGLHDNTLEFKDEFSILQKASDEQKQLIEASVSQLQTQIEVGFETTFQLTKAAIKKIDAFQEAVETAEQKAQMLFPAKDTVSRFQALLYSNFMKIAGRCAEFASGKIPADRADSVIRDLGNMAGTYIPLPGMQIVSSLVVGVSLAIKKKYQKDKAKRQVKTNFEDSIEIFVKKIGLMYPQIEALTSDSIPKTASVVTALVLKHLTDHKIDKHIEAYAKAHEGDAPSEEYVANLMMIGLMWPESARSGWAFWDSGRVSWKGMEPIKFKNQSLFSLIGNTMLEWGANKTINYTTGQLKGRLEEVLTKHEFPDGSLEIIQEYALPLIDDFGDALKTQLFNRAGGPTAEAMFAHPVFLYHQGNGTYHYYHESTKRQDAEKGLNKYGVAFIDQGILGAFEAMKKSLTETSISSMNLPSKLVEVLQKAKDARGKVQDKMARDAKENLGDRLADNAELTVRVRRLTMDLQAAATQDRQEEALMQVAKDLHYPKSKRTAVECNDNRLVLRILKNESNHHRNQLEQAGFTLTLQDSSTSHINRDMVQQAVPSISTSHRSYTKIVIENADPKTLEKVKTMRDAVAKTNTQCVIS